MRFHFRAVWVVLLSASFVSAQQTLDHPIGVLEGYQHDSGLVANGRSVLQPREAHLVNIPGVTWLRLHFRDVVLEKGSHLRVTSLFDNESQILDAASMSLWNGTTAYFNGDSVSVELVADADTTKNRYAIFQIERPMIDVEPRGSAGQCGICGDTDDRVPSSETWTGRLLPAGCTATVWNEDSCLVSAGHCIFGSMVIQFNVPASNGNCSVNHPPIADQFPITSQQSSNGGVGNDWAVMTAGTNNLSQLPFERFGQLRPIATTPPVSGQIAELTGYGVDDTCTRSQTQQFADGPISNVAIASFQMNIDLRGGNSGSSLIRNGEIIGIATHCPCPNYSTRWDVVNFVNARDGLCGGFGVPPNDLCSNAIPFNGGLGDGVAAYTNNGASGDGPANPLNTCNDAGFRRTGRDIWFTYVASCTGTLIISTCDDVHGAGNPTYDSDIVLYGPFDNAESVSCDGRDLVAMRIGCNDDDAAHACGVSPGASTVVVPAVFGKAYLIRVGGKSDFDSGDGFLSVMCAPITGACCFDDGSCQELENTDCTDALGVYQGDGTICSPNPCPQPCDLLGDVNQDDTVDGMDIAGYLRAKFSLPGEPGEDLSCAEYLSGTVEGDTALFVDDLLTK